MVHRFEEIRISCWYYQQLIGKKCIGEMHLPIATTVLEPPVWKKTIQLQMNSIKSLDNRIGFATVESVFHRVSFKQRSTITKLKYPIKYRTYSTVAEKSSGKKVRFPCLPPCPVSLEYDVAHTTEQIQYKFDPTLALILIYLCQLVYYKPDFIEMALREIWSK
jgi:hypothetical protein